jgi:hypothetical protein
MKVADLKSADDADFLAGRDLAVSMIRNITAFHQATVADTLSIEAQYRVDGRPQANVAAVYLRRVLDNPALAEGFAAVLTDGLSNGFPDVEVYEALTVSEMRGPKHDSSFQAFLSGLSGDPQ